MVHTFCGNAIAKTSGCLIHVVSFKSSTSEIQDSSLPHLDDCDLLVRSSVSFEPSERDRCDKEIFMPSEFNDS